MHGDARAVVADRVDPVSRNQESSIGSSTTSTSPVSAARAPAASAPGLAIIVTGSKAPTAFATEA
jgi:hypothetical protein